MTFFPKYHTSTHLDDRWDELRGNIPNGSVTDPDGQIYHGITCCNVPIGSQTFVETYLSEKLGKVTRGFDRVQSLLDPGRWPHPEIPSRQMLWILTLVCFQFMGDYWLRHVRPDYTEAFAQGIDEGILSLVQTCVGVDIASLTEIGRERMRLPIRFKGCGLRQATDRRYAQYLGAFAQSTMHLIDRTDQNNCTIEGRLKLPSIVAMLGEGSFNHPFTAPWSCLLSTNESSNSYADGLKHAWSHLQHNFQDVSSQERASDPSLLLNQDISRAGFGADGTVSRSVTNAVTIELERSRQDHLGKRIETSMDRGEYERWSWAACTKMSSIFLHSPPDHFGYMEDPVFQVAWTTYLGQACPLMAPVVGRYFGKNGDVLDKYGANLASASLPGAGHRALHNKLQSILQAMMRLGGIYSEKEAANFLLDKIGEPYITRYVNHVASHPNIRKSPLAIVPDLHATNFPAGHQRVNDSGATSTAEAIFEIKTFTACKSRYRHTNRSSKPVDRREREVTQSYNRKFKKLDKQFAAEVVGDGSNDIVGPFEASQQRFYRGQVVPMCSGWFGEIGGEFEKIIWQIAREAAAGDDGLTISPLVNTDRKGGAFPIMLQQFKRAISVAIVRGNAKHKLGRLHYVRATAAEAAAVCGANHSDNKWRPSQNGRASWYSQHTPEGYGTFEQFRNGYDFCVP